MQDAAFRGRAAGAGGVPQSFAVALHEARVQRVRTAGGDPGAGAGTEDCRVRCPARDGSGSGGVQPGCFKVHGHDRGMELLDAIKKNTATVVERVGRITGYATVVGFFGHTVGETNEDVQALIGAAKEFAGPGFLLPTRNGELFRWCLKARLRVMQPMTLMSAGLYNEPTGAFLPSILY